ncbi:MAG: DNA polymerase IV [Bacteroidota bacterium]
MAAKVRSIVHADLDTFFVSVERLEKPELRHRPVIVGGDRDARGVVAACSYETRVLGVRSGMPLRTAARLCPSAVFLPGRFSLYREHSRAVTALLQDEVPVLEKASIDEFYMDLTGCESLLGDPERWCHHIGHRVSVETGLPITLGLASNKLMAKMATNRAKRRVSDPGSLFRVGAIPAGTEAAFLMPLKIDELPGIGKQTAKKLRDYGFETLGDIQHAPAAQLEHLFGAHGASMHRRARGLDDRPVLPVRTPKSIGHETTFREDIDDLHLVLKTLRRLSERTATDLRQKKKSATRVTLKWRYADFETLTRSVSIQPSDEAITLYEAVLPAVRTLFQPARGVRLLGVRAEGLTEPSYQASLYEPPPEQRRELLRAIDELRRRYGPDIIGPGSLK